MLLCTERAKMGDFTEINKGNLAFLQQLCFADAYTHVKDGKLILQSACPKHRKPWVQAQPCRNQEGRCMPETVAGSEGGLQFLGHPWLWSKFKDSLSYMRLYLKSVKLLPAALPDLPSTCSSPYSSHVPIVRALCGSRNSSNVPGYMSYCSPHSDLTEAAQGRGKLFWLLLWGNTVMGQA